MQPSLDHPTPTLPSFLDQAPAPATVPNPAARRRRMALWASLLAVPVAAAIGAVVGTRRASLVAGGLTALGLGVLRWQLARWFTDSPAYRTIGKRGELELREYPLHLEVRTETDATDVETALGRGFGRLACYIYGANADAEQLAMTTPIVTTMLDGVYTTAFVMPPHRPLSSLPRPKDLRVELREVAGRQLAVYPFQGRLTRANIEHHERRFLRALVDAGLAARGSVALATYDSPATLPALRRNELWIAIV